jgi:hypothetical protein
MQASQNCAAWLSALNRISGTVSSGVQAEQYEQSFGQRGIQVQHERIGVGAELGNDEANLVRPSSR